MKQLFLLSLILFPGLLFSQEWVNDDSFLHTALNGGDLFSTCQQPDGKIILGGSFNILNGPSGANITRLNANGTLDTTFTPIYFTTNYPVIKLQPDGKILAGGNGGIRRYHPNGEFDSIFNYPPLVATVYSVGLQSDGKIIVGGDLNTFDGQLIDNMIRLNTDGTLDTTFSIPELIANNGGGTNYIAASLVMPNDKIIIVGGFGYVLNGNFHTGLVRLNADGSLDTTFIADAGFGPGLLSMVMQSDGKILIAGAQSVRRFNSDGSPDNSFTMPQTSNSIVRTVAVLPDGKIFMGGDFLEVNGQYAKYIALLDANGTLDVNQGILHEFTGGGIRIIQLQNNGRVLIGGGMISNSLGYGSIGRFIENLPQDSLVINAFSWPAMIDSCNGGVMVFASGPPDFIFELGTENPVISSDVAGFGNLCPGIYTINVTDGNSNSTNATVIVPVDSSYIFNNPYIDSIPVDSLGFTLEDCEIDFSSIDTASIDSIFANGNTVNVIWNIVDSNGSNFDTTSYVLNNGNGVYWLQLSVYCPFKSIEKYFVVTEVIHFNDGNINTTGLPNYGKELVEIYPNPTNDQIHISFSSSDAELKIYDLQGKVVLKDRIQNNGMVSLQNFERGVYLFDFKNSQGHSVKRVVKQ